MTIQLWLFGYGPFLGLLAATNDHRHAEHQECQSRDSGGDYRGPRLGQTTRFIH